MTLPGNGTVHCVAMSREGWQGFVYVAFVIDTFADRIVGWRGLAVGQN
jgi:transposase InsO family protein